MSSAVYAGTFDPLTFGHLDVAARAAQVFSELVVAVAEDPRKTLLFSAEERMELARASLAHLPNVKVELFGGLLVDWARQRGIHTLIRGLRAFSDFEYEFQMVGMNRAMNDDVETVFLMADAHYQAIASRLVKEIARLGGDVSGFVPAPVAAALAERFSVAPVRPKRLRRLRHV